MAAQATKDLAMDDLTRPSFLSYRGPEPRLPEPPSRVYGRVDQIEPIESRGPEELSTFNGDRVALLDAVDARWFDADARERERLADEATVDEADENVSVVVMAETDLREALAHPSTLEASWIEIELDESGAGPPVLHYLNLFAAPIERSLVRATWALPPLNRDLAEKTSMDDVPDATEEELAGVLDALGSASAAAVYDVGQGGCNAVLSSGIPSLYFDFGGGVLAHRNTFPPPLTRFCFTQQPPIVLSHWDWDHWSSANRDSQAYAQTWIVPRQGANGLGAVHRTFLARILQKGSVLVWPDALASLQRGPYELLKCGGPISSRNNSGLALVLEEPGSDDSQRMLFPGDCAYDYISRAKESDFTALVCPHHGGRTKASFVPASDRNPSGRIVYSYGQDNSYGHPFASVCSDHVNAGWRHARETPSRCPSRSMQAPSHVLGHVHLHWDSAAPDEHPGCGGRTCQLTCHQR
jgi:beta-lactamase superfamily II metal-dependent hydrolase